MALQAIFGFDDTVAEIGARAGGVAGRSGGQAANTGVGTVQLCVFPGAATVIIGVAVKFSVVGIAGDVLQFRDTAGNIHVRLRQNTSSGIDLYGPANTLVASSAGLTLLAGGWHYLQTKILVADAGGTVDVLADGLGNVLSYTGDTRNGGTAAINELWGVSASGSSTFDDVYICDTTGSAPYNTFLGDCVVRTILPTGDGVSSQLTGSDGNSVNNSLLVDETNSSMTDYVAAASAGLTDLYAMGDIPTTDGVLAYKNITYALKSDAGVPPAFKPVARGASGTVREETALVLNTVAQSFPSPVQITDPDGNALNPTRVNAMQAGVRSA